MARPATGHILERVDSTGAIRRSLRFRANGRRHSIPLGVVSRAEAERELQFVLADVARGVWKPAEAIEQTAPAAIPTFHVLAERHWTLNEAEWAPNTQDDYRWRLEKHLIPYFGELLVTDITGGVIKQYGADKLREASRIREAAAAGEPIMEEIEDKRGRKIRRRVKPLSPRSINMTITLLGAILESAIDDDDLGQHMQRNHARGRRIKEKKPRRSYLETAGQIRALLDAAGELDAKAARDRRHVERRAMLAVLTFAGLRIGELLALRWCDVDLATGWLTVGEAKTDAGRRRVKLRAALRDDLAALRARAGSGDGLVFPTRTGRQASPENFRGRVLAAAVKRANESLGAEGLPSLPVKLTPHSLRRTFCSLLYALGEDPGTVMDEMGHTDPALALRIYRQAMRRGEQEKAQLRALMEGAEFGQIKVHEGDLVAC